jgi:hypothetical protein
MQSVRSGRGLPATADDQYTSGQPDRRRGERRTNTRVRLIRKLADTLNGIDLSACEVGDVFALSRREAELLIREGWAVPAVGEPLTNLNR